LEANLKDQAKKREDARKNGLNHPPPFEAMQNTAMNRFTVFESYTDMLEKIDDDQLREKIIMVYGRVKGFIDLLNADARGFEHWRSLPDDDPHKQIVAGVLVHMQVQLRNTLAVLPGALNEVRKELKKYLDH
jgi:hypothetical protein